MATPFNEKFAICDEVIVEECQRIEMDRSGKTSGENTTGCTTVSSAMVPISRTELQDLPIEVLDYILMKAVVKKVMDRKLAKPVWLDYASRVIQPMRTVWSRWNCSLRTNWFRIVLSRILSNKNPVAVSVAAISVAAIEEELCDLNYTAFTKLGNQIYIACTDLLGRDGDDSDDDFDYSFLMVLEVQGVLHCTKTISLPITEGPVGMAACRQSNYVYLWGHGSDVLHLVPDGNGGSEVLYWPPYSAPSDFVGSDTAGKSCYSIDSFSVLDGGNLLVQRCFIRIVDLDQTYEVKDRITILSVHQPNGFVVRNIKLPKICESSDVVMKSNGNFVCVELRKALVTELNQDGKIVRHSHWKGDHVDGYEQLFLDSCDRVILQDDALNLTFFDAELNFICEVPLELELDDDFIWVDACFCKETNELIILSITGQIVFVKLAL